MTSGWPLDRVDFNLQSGLLPLDLLPNKHANVIFKLFLKMGHPKLFLYIFVLLKHKFYRKN